MRPCIEAEERCLIGAKRRTRAIPTSERRDPNLTRLEQDEALTLAEIQTILQLFSWLLNCLFHLALIGGQQIQRSLQI